MDASQFTMWLQGFAELNAEPPTKEQWQSIREHLQLVFTKVTPEVKKLPEKVDPAEALRNLIGKGPAIGGWWPGYPQYPQPDGVHYWLDRPSTGNPGVITC